MKELCLFLAFIVLESIIGIFHLKNQLKKTLSNAELVPKIISLPPSRGKIFFSELHGIVSEQIISILQDPDFPYRTECVIQQNVGLYIPYIQPDYQKYLKEYQIFGNLCDTSSCYADAKTMAREVHKNAKNSSLDSFQLMIGGFPPTMSHYFLGLNISTITLLTVPFYDRIENLEMMKLFLETQRQLLTKKDPKHLILANNQFSAKHFEHFSGIHVSDVYWGYPNYVSSTWSGQKSTKILVSRNQQGFISSTLNVLWSEMSSSFFQKLKFIQSGDKQGEFSEIAQYRAVVFFPYVPSVMAFFEFFKMGIPIFAPSKTFMTEDVTNDWYVFATQWGKLRLMANALEAPITTFVNDQDYWLSQFDMYQFPCLVYFDSFFHLIQQIKANLGKTNEIHQCMMEYNVKWKKRNILFWKNTLERLFPVQMNKDRGNMELVMTQREIPKDFDEYTQQFNWHKFNIKDFSLWKWQR